jgi:hypothetical protein
LSHCASAFAFGPSTAPTTRTDQLRGPLAEKWIGNVKLPQWQHEVSGAGRVFYCPDRGSRVVWVTRVDLAHPKETE